MKYPTLAASLLMAAAPLIQTGFANEPPTAQKPNIVFFFVDDLGWADLGYNGATYHLTPNIDRFSRQAMVFDNAYSMPTCSPARASLFTGMVAPRTGIYHVPEFWRTPPEHFKMQPVKSGKFFTNQIDMLSDQLKAAGYATGYVGKWHVDEDPTKHGFDFNAGGGPNGGPPSYFSPYKLSSLEDGPNGEYLPDRLLQEARGFIRSNKQNPFFLCYAPYLVHRPLQAREEDIARFKERETEEARFDPTYAAMVEATDRVFQGLLDTLAEEGLTDNTFIVFTSDNGMNGLVGDSTPLRGEKGSCYEGGIRVPTMVYWPGVTEARHTQALIDVVDWFPTLLEVGGAAQPSHTLDGLSIVPVLNGSKASVREAVYIHMPCYNGEPGSKQIWQTPFSAILSGDYKLIHFYEDQRNELYNLKEDIGESINLASSMPEKAKVLHDQLNQWLDQHNAPRPQPKP